MRTDIFRPLFEATVNPSKYPNLHHFLKQIVGIDCVDDESKPEKRLPRYPVPQEWTSVHNPPYSYYLYYLYVAPAHSLPPPRFRTHAATAMRICTSSISCANLSASVRSLFRDSSDVRIDTIAFRPHAGEAGDPDHLASSFLLAANISHGVNLRKTPALQYLYVTLLGFTDLRILTGVGTI